MDELNGNSLLKIKRPREIFGEDADEAKKVWHRLANLWHPDHNSDSEASEVFAHLSRLYDAAKRVFEDKIESREITFDLKSGNKPLRISFVRETKTETGSSYLSKNSVSYLFNRSEADLAVHASSILGDLPYRDEKMREGMKKVLPQSVKTYEIVDGRFLLVLSKDYDYIPLLDLKVCVGILGPRHVAWILSGMLNLVCYLESVGLAHQDIDMSTLLVNPKGHSVALFGGWWCAGKQDKPWKVLPGKVAKIAPPSLLSAKKHDVKLDQYLVRETARSLLKEQWTTAPNPMRNFIELPPVGSALDDYTLWDKVLRNSFGERKFVKLSTSADDVYNLL